MSNQVFSFAIFILNGFLIGILFDIFRILRKSFKTPDFMTYIEDVVFWILSGLILLYSIFKFNNGELRLFIFLGVFIGSLIYLLVFSKLLIDISVYVIKIFKNMIKILIIIPIKFIIRIVNKTVFKPSKYLIINVVKIIKKMMSIFKSKTKNKFFINLNNKNKKDFTWICRNILYTCIY